MPEETKTDKVDLIDLLKSQGETEKSARMIIKELIQPENIELKTHLSERETLTFAKSDFFANELQYEGFESEAELIRSFKQSLMKNRLSFNRLSRVEFVDGMKPEIEQQNIEERAKLERTIR